MAAKVRALAAALSLLVTMRCDAAESFDSLATVSPDQISAALNDAPRTGDAPAFFAPPEPRRLRPCCAFGNGMKVKLLGVPVPWYRHKPVRDLHEVGPHEYDPGVLQVFPGPVRVEGLPSRENNGIVYTCRGGFFDTAHIRDFADHAWFLAGRVEKLLSTGGTIDLRDYGGRRRITIRPVPEDRLREVGRSSLAIALGARLSFELSVWREIATWYGYESVPPWPEKLSSFSPEDLRSNLLGTKIAAGILSTTRIDSALDWDRAMSAWLPAVLEALGAVPGDSARERMQSVDGGWWNSQKWIPDWRITVRRKFDAGPVLEPWLLESPAGDPCAGAAPQDLRVEDEFRGVRLAEVASIDVARSDRLVRHGYPKSASRVVHETDLAGLIDAVRSATDAGLAADGRATPPKDAAPSSDARSTPPKDAGLASDARSIPPKDAGLASDARSIATKDAGVAADAHSTGEAPAATVLSHRTSSQPAPLR